MDNDRVQTQGQGEENPVDAGTDSVAPQDLLDEGTDLQGQVAPKTLPDLDFPEDPLEDIPTDALPNGEREKVEKSIRDGWLRLSNKVDHTVKRLEQREREYMDAIQRLAENRQAPETTESPNYEGLSAQQIVEKIADERAKAAFEQMMQERGLSQSAEKTDAIMRQLQILEAKQSYPDLDRYENQLVQLGGILEEKLGREKAMLFSVSDMMHIIKGREGQRRRITQSRRPSQPQQQRPSQPQTSIARAGVSPRSVEPSQEPSSMAEAFKMAQEKHGPYNPTLNR